MKSVSQVLSWVGLTIIAGFASSAPAWAGHGGYDVSVYRDGRGHGVAVSVQGNRHGYRPSGHVPYQRYPDTRASAQPASWCPTHGVSHNHSYGYYGFNGGYYGVYDGNSYEEVFSRAYDDGYSDGYNALGSQLRGGTRPYRKGYVQGYRDGRRDGRNAGDHYRDD